MVFSGAAGATDGVAAGVTPGVAALAAQLRDAAHVATPLRIVGGGSWLTAGRPSAGDLLEVSALRGIIEYVPGDLTLTAAAGTTLGELHNATAAHGQWLGLDPAANPDATIGALVATASDGPLAISMGRVRDMVLGLQCITGTGAIIRAGGRVVKNVAGFDLVRLHTGAWGTLGAITEVSLRLRARPPLQRSFVFTSDDSHALEAWLAPLADITIEPMAMELLNAPLAAALGLPDSRCLLVRLGGNAERVEAQRLALRALGSATEVPTELWDALARMDALLDFDNTPNSTQHSTEHPARTPRRISARVSHSPTLLPALWRHLIAHCAAHALSQPLIRASVTRGLARLVLTPPDVAALVTRTDARAFVTALAPHGAHAAWEQLPNALWSAVPSPVADAVSQAIRRALDPGHILNRGLLGEPQHSVITASAMTEPRDTRPVRA